MTPDDPRARDQLRRHLRRRRRADGRVALERHLLAARPRPLRRRRARDRLAPPSRARQRRRRAGARRGRRDPRRRSTSSPPPSGPGLVGALLVGFSRAKALAAARELPFAPVDHLQGHVAANFLPGRRPQSVRAPFLCLIASGGHTLLAQVDRRTRLRGPRPHARRRGRRGLRQGRAHARPRLSRAARPWSAWPRDGDPEAFDFPGSPPSARGGGRRSVRPHARLLLRRPEDRAALPPPRARRARPRARAAPISPPPTRPRSSSACSRAPSRRWRRTGLDRLAVGGGVAANGELARASRSWVPTCTCPTARAVHRQRRHDRLRRPLPAARCPTRTTSLSTPTRPANARSRPRPSSLASVWKAP